MRHKLAPDELCMQGNVIGTGPKHTITSIQNQPLAHFVGTIPFYRLPCHRSDGSGGEYFYTHAEEERVVSCAQNGYWSEGIACRIWTAQQPRMVPLYRLWCTAVTHVFVTSQAGKDWWMREKGAADEGIVGYVYPSADRLVGLVPLYCVTAENWGRLLTVSDRERMACIRLGARDEGILCFVAPP